MIINRLKNYIKLPKAAKAESQRDRKGVRANDPGVEMAIKEGIHWLSRAQDNSLSHDGGVARHYSYINGWSSSYPETTGYIIPTMLDYAELYNDAISRERARKMLDWLVSIQYPEGGFQGGLIQSLPKVPVTFNTGQILIGLARGTKEFGDEYRIPMQRAADWLVETLDSDGCWRKHGTPFAAPGEKTYETHVSWGLFEAARIEPNKDYSEAAMRNIKWALQKQHPNGWFDNCCLSTPEQPLTHTLGYALRGLVEAYRFTEDDNLLQSCRKTAEGLLTAINDDGSIPGRLNKNWKSTVEWYCLTGIVQIAHCWLMLYQFTGDAIYRDTAFKANSYVRRTISIDDNQDTRGGVKGSFPVNGGYCAYEFLNWACKFMIDSNILESEIKNNDISVGGDK